MADKRKYHPGGSIPAGRKRAVRKRNVDPRPSPLGKKRAVKKRKVIATTTPQQPSGQMPKMLQRAVRKRNVDPRPSPLGKRPTPKTGGGMKLPTKKVRPPKPSDTNYGGGMRRPKLPTRPPKPSDTNYGGGMRRPKLPTRPPKPTDTGGRVKPRLQVDPKRPKRKVGMLGVGVGSKDPKLPSPKFKVLYGRKGPRKGGVDPSMVSDAALAKVPASMRKQVAENRKRVLTTMKSRRDQFNAARRRKPPVLPTLGVGRANVSAARRRQLEAKQKQDAAKFKRARDTFFRKNVRPTSKRKLPTR